MFIKQDPMRRVTYALVPMFLWSTYLYGWRVVALTGLVFLLGILTEFIFEKTRNKKVSEAVLVTCGLFALSLPPAVPFWVAGVGIIFAVIFGKEVYGGFGRNIFNPAIAGRIFTYISFPLLMQTTWMLPGMFGITGVNNQIAGSSWPEAVFMLAAATVAFIIITRNPGNKKVLAWTAGLGTALIIAFYVIISYAGWKTGAVEIDIITTATPIELMRGVGAIWEPKAGYGYLEENGLVSMFFGFRVGSIGEGAIFLIILAGAYLLFTKTANWRMMINTFASALILTIILYETGLMKARLPMMDPAGKDLLQQTADILRFMMAGSLLYVAVFMSTDPVSAPKKPIAQHLYGIIIGSVTILVRCFSAFPEGTSFGILMANTFSSLIDDMLPARKKAEVKAPAPVAVAASETKGGQS